jgi:hypothetical protein
MEGWGTQAREGGGEEERERGIEIGVGRWGNRPKMGR